MSSILLLLMLDKPLGSLFRNSFFVSEDQEWCVANEQTIDIFKCPACGLRV